MITEAELSDLFEEALNFEANKEVNPAEARKRIADKLANGVAQFTQGRTVTVTGVQIGAGTAAGTID